MHDHSAFKQQLYDQFARIGKAISSAKRLEIIELLSQGEKTVESIAQHAGLTTGNASAHLQVLRNARLVEARKDGKYVAYRLADEAVFRFFRAYQSLATQRLAELDQMIRLSFGSPDELEPVNALDLLARLRREDVIVLDVRPAGEHRAGHIPGAIPMPLEEVERRLNELPLDREVVAYCRGPYCVFSLEAVRLLRRRGYRARRLAIGLPDWRAAGFPVSVAS